MRAGRTHVSLAVLFVFLGAHPTDGRAFVDERDPSQVEAVFRIEEIGGQVTGRPFRKPPRAYVALKAPINDADLARLTKVKGLKAILLQGPGFHDEGLSVVATLTELEHLTLSCPKVTDKGLQRLQSLKQLQSLAVRCPRVTDNGIEAIRRSLPSCRVY